PRVRCLAQARARGSIPLTHVSGRPVFAVAGREPSTDPGLMNPGSVDAPRLRTGARYRRAVARAPSRRHPAPPCPSLLMTTSTSRSPAKGLATLDLEDAGLGSSWW